MSNSQITVRPRSTARRILAIVATAAIVSGASLGAALAAETDAVWPDHLVDPDGGVQLAEFVWPDHLVQRDEAFAATSFMWPDHLVARGGSGVALADDEQR